MRVHEFSAVRSGERLDKLIAASFPTLSRSYVQHLIEQKLVAVNDKNVSAHFSPKAGDRITLSIPKIEQSGIVAADIELKIVYEDADIVVIDKPAGMVVHPSDSGGHMADSVVNALLYRYKDWSMKGTARPGIVHRLDKDTSGLLLIAKDDQAMNFMARQWQNRTVDKKYYTLVAGNMPTTEGLIEAPLGRSSTDRKKMAVTTGKKSRESYTRYTVIQEFEKASLLEVEILTGRTHQIRVHFQSLGHPVVGDSTYGNSKINAQFEKGYGLKRQFLHAYSLAFDLPSSRERKKIKIGLAPDLQKVIDVL